MGAYSKIEFPGPPSRHSVDESNCQDMYNWIYIWIHSVSNLAECAFHVYELPDSSESRSA